MFLGCLVAVTASRPQPALRAGDCSLALAVSLDPATATRRWDLGVVEFHGGGKVDMLRIYRVILDTVETMQPVVRRIELRDRDLGRQLRRASCSIALNVAEGMYSRGQNRQVRYHSALGSRRSPAWSSRNVAAPSRHRRRSVRSSTKSSAPS